MIISPYQKRSHMQKTSVPIICFLSSRSVFTEMELDLNNEHFFQNLANFVKEARESHMYVHLIHDDILSAFQKLMNAYDINAVFLMRTK